MTEMVLVVVVRKVMVTATKTEVQVMGTIVVMITAKRMLLRAVATLKDHGPRAQAGHQAMSGWP